MSTTKKRLDLALQEMHPELSRNYLQQCIKNGKVLINGTPCTKPGAAIEPESTIEIEDAVPKFVSRGGFKLEAALDHFKIDVRDLIALDAGISTGGFTDCLLQRGAKKVYGVEVGTAQVHPSIASDPRVILYENTNLRELTALPEPIDLATLDLSFISLTKIIPALAPLMAPQSCIMALIKPQFEAERHEIRRGGLITDPAIHNRVKEKITAAFQAAGFTCAGIIDSPLLGAASGNKEFLGLFKKTSL